MDKQAFKQRMQNLKSYRENNPGKGYWDWRNSLPDNLKYTDDTEYDMVGAYNSGAQPTLEDDGSYHLPTRVPSTGKVLKSSIHPTYWKGLAEDEKLGYHTYWLPDGSTYTASKYDAPIQAFADGGQNNTPIVDSLNKEQLARIETRDGENQYERIMKNDKSITESLLKSGYYQFNAGELPEVKIGPEQLYAELNTYYPITSRYPFTGHSEIITPEKSSISLSGAARKYNLITNNCSDATRCALENVFGKKVNPIAFTTPGDVRDFASENLNAIKVKSYEPGTTTQLIPLTNQQAKQLEYEAYKAYRVNNNLPVVDIETFWKRYYTKADSFQNGGEVDEFQRKTRRDIMQQSLVDGRPNYNKMFQNQNEYQKDFANYWYTERAKNPKYSDQIGGDKLGSVLSNIDKATWKTPTEAMRDNMVGQGYNPTDAQINQQLNILKEKGTKGFANPKAHSYTSLRPANTWHEGVGHMVGDNTPAILNASPNVRISNPDSSYEDYVNQANEKHAQTWDFRGNNSNLKDDQGNYYIDPNRQLTPEDISNMRSKGAKIPEQWESLEDADISELTNTFAYNMYQDPVQYMANGGEVGDPDDEFTKAINTKLGRTPDGRPLQQGLKPVFDLEDAANLTPVGDVLSAKEAYDAVKQNDWLGAGLAGLGFIPFIPKGVRRIARQTPTVNRTFEQKVAEMEKRVSNRRKMMEEFYDQRNRTYELLNTPEARRRAADIDQKYGTEYNKVYDKLTKEYEDITSYVNMVEPEFVKDPDAFVRIKPAKSGKKISLSEDNITKPEDFPTGLIRHEIGHYVDEMAYPGGVPNNAYLRQLGKPSKYRPFEEVKDIFRSPDKALQDYRYLRNPTEKKSIMNQFDEYLMNNYTPSTYPQTTKEFKEAIEKAPDIHRNMKLLLKIHNKPSILFKDFKNRPLVNNTTKDKNKELV